MTRRDWKLWTIGDFNVLRQNDIMTGRDRGHRTIGDFNVLRQNDIMTGRDWKLLHRQNDTNTKSGWGVE